MQITTESIQDHIPYYLTQDAKEKLVEALDGFPRQIEYYINLFQADILQGDGWNSLELIRFENGERKLVKGILLSNSCDIDINNKRDLPPKLTFSPIINLNRYIGMLANVGLDKDKIEAKVVSIKEQKVSTLFYLPKGAGLEEDYIALLDMAYTLPFPVFAGRNDKQKLFTLSQVGFYLFLLKLSVHFCRFHENIARD